VLLVHSYLRRPTAVVESILLMVKFIPMKLVAVSFILSVFVQLNANAQNSFPKLDTNLLVRKSSRLMPMNKPYTVVVYGALGCGYSRLLIQNIGVLDECRSKADIVLIMLDTKDSLVKYMDKVVDKYATFSNFDLQYKIRKKSKIVPHVLVFRNQIQVEHIVAIKEGMLTKIKNRIADDGY